MVTISFVAQLIVSIVESLCDLKLKVQLDVEGIMNIEYIALLFITIIFKKFLFII